ncbi:hypothetical protein HRbin35_00475 [bacterium HR35]|nr:hypothetical protein HRbin35_00475 [bacterium HR35]
MKREYLIFLVGIIIVVLIFVLVFYFDIFSIISFKLPQKVKTSSKETIKVEETKIVQPSSSVKINETNYQNFNLDLENESLGEKNTIKASLNDVLTLNLTAKDKNYEIFIENYNLSSKIKKEETKTIQFQALEEGSFKIICNNCKNKLLGYIIITK